MGSFEDCAAAEAGGIWGMSHFRQTQTFPSTSPPYMKGKAVGARPSGQLSGSRACREDGAARDAELETKQNNFALQPFPSSLISSHQLIYINEHLQQLTLIIALQMEKEVKPKKNKILGEGWCQIKPVIGFQSHCH